MPERPLTVVTYAAGASLAAITLIYVFAPTYFLDSEPSGSSPTSLLTSGSRKKGVVGLANPANDCFINSILQALAGLGDLRQYLIREIHRRSISDASVYTEPVPEDFRRKYGGQDYERGEISAEKVTSEQKGLATQGLKDILDQLNERPIYKKTITAVPFVRVLEDAFQQKINRQQQDAQEFLQVVVERLCEEYYAGCLARKYARWQTDMGKPNNISNGINGNAVEERLAALALEENQTGSAADSRQSVPTIHAETMHGTLEGSDEEEGFPLEGRSESQIECLTCGFKPRPKESKFRVLTLSVPEASTTLNHCFDGMFKTEYIEDFKCEKCRLIHAQAVLEAEIKGSKSAEFKERAQAALAKLQTTIETDPEQLVDDIVLPDSKYAPRRKIARHTRITSFPKILSVHLSRSIYNNGQTPLRNSAKVSFPELLPLGGLLQRKKYKLLGVVTHKGSHDSGHYESFRRQNIYPPFSNSNTFQASGVYSKTASPMSTPQMGAVSRPSMDSSPLISTPELLSPSSLSTPSLESMPPTSSSRRSTLSLNGSLPKRGPTSAPRESPKEKDTDTSSLRSVAATVRSALSRMPPSRNGSSNGSRSGTPVPNGTAKSTAALPSDRKKKKSQDRWWRISDEKIKEARTRELLGMQREVYLLFYELERDAP